MKKQSTPKKPLTREEKLVKKIEGLVKRIERLEAIQTAMEQGKPYPKVALLRMAGVRTLAAKPRVTKKQGK